MLCDDCVEQLIATYEFVNKLIKSEEIFVEQSNEAQRTLPASTPPTVVTDKTDEYEMVYINNEMELNKELYANAENVADELAKENTVNDIVEEQILEIDVDMVGADENIHITDVQPQKPTKKSLSLLKKNYTDKSDNIAGNLQRSNVFVTVPQYTVNTQIVDDECDSIQSKTIKTIDVSAIRIAQNHIPDCDEIETDDKEYVSDSIMYMCQYCPKAFSTSHHLLVHTRKSHVCLYCCAGFNKVIDLHKHVKEEHNKFGCPLCAKEFNSNSNLRAHIKRVHNVKLPSHMGFLTVKSDEVN